MDASAELVTARPAEVVRSYVEDLSSYPAWMRLVHQVQRLDGDDAAWSVELRARLGPFARSKRLRMVRREPSECDAADGTCERIVFERREDDGRHHAPWILTLELTTLEDAGTRLRVHLHYGGRLWSAGVLDRILDEEIDRARGELLRLLDAH